jgi:pimeloyl-ACP methyl ester carboxylesterase
MSRQIIMRLAGLLFAAALVFPTFEAVRAQPSTERQETVKAGAATIRVTVRGRGDPIVFIPSFGRGAEDFEDLSKRLVQAGYRAILPQPRGIGGSTGPMDTLSLHAEAADIAAVIQSLAGGRAIVLGHAHGNGVARMVASDYPALVRQVILLAAGGMVPRAPDIDQAFRRVFDPTLSRQERLAAIQRSFFANGNNAAVWQDGWYFDVAAAQMAGAARTPLPEYWPGGSAPILVLQATEDVIAVPENSRLLAAEFPNRVTVVQIPNSGHAMLPEQPERIAAAILNYMRR